MSLWQKYLELPRTGRLWIGITTLVVAYGGGKIVDSMYEETLVREEAKRRLELKQMQERKEQQEANK